MSNNQITKDVRTIQDYLAGRVNNLRVHLLDACNQLNEVEASAVMADLLDAEKVKQTSEAMVNRENAEPTVAEYLISSLTISEACQILTKTPDEDLRFATGMAVATMKYAVTRLLEFQLKRTSAVIAEGEQRAVSRLMIALHNVNHKLLMTTHSHPGSGPNSTEPSSTDRDFHRRLEAGKYPAIGLIVNREGYVRFFSYKRKFKITIQGKGMELINEKDNLFKLNKIYSV